MNINFDKIIPFLKKIMSIEKQKNVACSSKYKELLDNLEQKKDNKNFNIHYKLKILSYEKWVNREKLSIKIYINNFTKARDIAKNNKNRDYELLFNKLLKVLKSNLGILNNSVIFDSKIGVPVCTEQEVKFVKPGVYLITQTGVKNVFELFTKRESKFSKYLIGHSSVLVVYPEGSVTYFSHLPDYTKKASIVSWYAIESMKKASPIMSFRTFPEEIKKVVSPVKKGKPLNIYPVNPLFDDIKIIDTKTYGKLDIQSIFDLQDWFPKKDINKVYNCINNSIRLAGMMYPVWSIFDDGSCWFKKTKKKEGYIIPSKKEAHCVVVAYYVLYLFANCLCYELNISNKTLDFFKNVRFDISGIFNFAFPQNLYLEFKKYTKYI